MFTKKRELLFIRAHERGVVEDGSLVGIHMSAVENIALRHVVIMQLSLKFCQKGNSLEVRRSFWKKSLGMFWT